MALKLNKEEIETRVRKLVLAMKKLESTESSQRDAKKAMREDLEAQSAKIRILREEIRTGERWEPDQAEIPGTEQGSGDDGE